LTTLDKGKWLLYDSNCTALTDRAEVHHLAPDQHHEPVKQVEAVLGGGVLHSKRTADNRYLAAQTHQAVKHKRRQQ
jgi:hypothetical protein